MLIFRSRVTDILNGICSSKDDQGKEGAGNEAAEKVKCVKGKCEIKMNNLLGKSLQQTLGVSRSQSVLSARSGELTIWEKVRM